jgi:hypothetical protein
MEFVRHSMVTDRAARGKSPPDVSVDGFRNFFAVAVVGTAFRGGPPTQVLASRLQRRLCAAILGVESEFVIPNEARDLLFD